MSNHTAGGDVSVPTSAYDSYVEKQLVAAFCCLISIAGVTGNSVVLLAVILSRKPRTTTNVFVVNLAVADLFICLSLPFMALALLSESSEKLLVSESLCAFLGFVLIVCVGGSMNNIAAIAVYRALITRRKTRSRLISMFKRHSLAVIVATTWLIPFALGLLPIVSEFGSYEYDAYLSSCSFNPSAPGSKTFSIIMMVVFYPVQMVLTLASSAFIVFEVKKYLSKVNATPESTVATVGDVMRRSGLGQSDTNEQPRDRPSAPTFQTCVAKSQHPTGRHASRRRSPFRRGTDITCCLFIVVFFFMLCCTPYLIIMAVLTDRAQKIVPFLGALLLSNSCVNPVIYTARHPDFRLVCRCIMLCRLSKIPMKSSLLRRLVRFSG